MQITRCEQKVSLFENLLPNDEGKEDPLQRLEARVMLLQKAIEAAGHYLCGSREFFDPSVGDQACQIRALRFSLLFQERIEEEILEMKQSCVAAAEKIEAIRQEFLLFEIERDKEVSSIRINHLTGFEQEIQLLDKEKKAALQNVDKTKQKEIAAPFIQQFKEINQKKLPFELTIATLENNCRRQKNEALHPLELKVSRTALEVIQAYLLTITREHEIEIKSGACQYHEHLNFKKLMCGNSCQSARLMTDILDGAKRGIAESSVSYVRELAEDINSPKLRRMVETTLRIEKKKRDELPFYYLTEVIFQRAAALNVPVVLMVRNIGDHPLEEESYVGRMLFGTGLEGYEMCNPLEQDVPHAAIIIKAFSNATRDQLGLKSFQSEMIDLAGGLENLIGMNAAQHTQYTDQIPLERGQFDRIPNISQGEIEYLSQLTEDALVKGYSNPNPALCCIDHIYCGRLDNIFGSKSI